MGRSKTHVPRLQARRHLSDHGIAIAVAVLAATAPLEGQVATDPGRSCGVPSASSVRGTVVDRETGIPLATAAVSVTLDGRRDASATALADASGRVLFCGVEPDHRIELTATFGGVSASRNARAGRGSVQLELDLGEPTHLVFSLVDAGTDAPVPGATLRLDPLPLGGVADAAGRIALPRVPPGTYSVRADHIAFASFAGPVTVAEGGAQELRVELAPAVIALEPLRVRVTGRDPLLVQVGFYDRMAAEDSRSFTYWEVEPYARLSTFFKFENTFFVRGSGLVFVNGRPLARSGYRSVDELPFGKIRGIERIRCSRLPERALSYVEGFLSDCVATLIWVGHRRTRQVRPRPDGR